MKLNRLEQVIALLNISFGKYDDPSIKPFTTREWSNFAKFCLERSINIEDLLTKIPDIVCEYSKNGEFLNRLNYLLNRGTSLAICLEKWERAGIWLKFRKDKNYPKNLKEKLKSKSPVILYGVGDYSLINKNYIGIVGSRNPENKDLNFIEKFVHFIVKNSFNVVSGGAKGVDLKAMLTCLQAGGFSIGMISDSLLKYSVSKDYREFLSSGKLLLLSATNPEVGFNIGFAMQRNKYIYCMSKNTIIVTCTPNKGGTWAGAIENYKNNWVKMYVQKSEINCEGNTYLEKYGAIPILNNENDFMKIINSQTNVSDKKIVRENDHNNLIKKVPTYEEFLDTLKIVTTKGSLSLKDISKIFSLKRSDLNIFLKKGVNEKKIIKQIKPSLYIHHENSTQQKDLFN